LLTAAGRREQDQRHNSAVFGWFARALLLQSSVEPPGVGIVVTRSHTNRSTPIHRDYYIAEQWALRRPCSCVGWRQPGDSDLFCGQCRG
jgi:hypothetical protein